MEETKHQNGSTNLHHYWRLFLPLTVILALMVKFPLRIGIGELLYDLLFYGTISLICIATMIHVLKRAGKGAYRLIAIMLLCCLLSGWQVFDLYVLRMGRPAVYGFGNAMSPNFTDQDGVGLYVLRFPRDDILCHSLYERYYGNYEIAITVELNRDATWFACGG